MNPILFRAEVISPSVVLHPFKGEVPPVLNSGEPADLGSSEPHRSFIRHLLIGPPDTVHLTIHRLHQLGYAEAGLWSPTISQTSPQLTLTLNAGDVMRMLMRSL